MRDPFRNYDAWLEAPFQAMCAEQEREAQIVSDAIEAGDLPINPTEEEVAAYLADYYAQEFAEEESEVIYYAQVEEPHAFESEEEHYQE